MQSTVDGYEKMLADALAGLTLVEERNVNYVDNAKLTATASSHQDNGSAPDKALDGDTNTIWHSKWDITTMPHWIDLEMEEPMARLKFISDGPARRLGRETQVALLAL